MNERQPTNIKPCEERRVGKVIKGNARMRKKSEVSKFADVFISEDINNVKSYILIDVLVPSLKKAFSDIIKNGIDMLLYGTVSDKRNGSIAGRVSYRDYYDRNKDNSYGGGGYNSPYRSRAKLSYEDIVLDSRGEAEEVLYRMDEILEAYGVVRVADLFDLVGITGDFTDNNYGWSNIRTAEPVRLRDGGYVLRLPKPLPIKK